MGMGKDMKTDLKQGIWKERDFEEWFLSNPILPGGERLLVVDHQTAIRRVADIVCIDANGGLVIVEIKNEKTPRSVVGQALEYLSRYDAITSDELSDELGLLDDRSLSVLFSETFHKELPEISPSRRVILVAPEFDQHSCHGIEFLNRQFAQIGIKFLLLKAIGSDNQFVVDYVEPTPLLHSSKLVGRFGLTPSRTLIYVLAAGNPQIHWVLGQWEDGQLRFAKAQAITRRALRFGSRLLLPEGYGPKADFTLHDTTWRWRNKTIPLTAKVLGIVEVRTSDSKVEKFVFYAMCKNGRWGFRQRNFATFMKRWEKDDHAVPSWHKIVELVKSQRFQLDDTTDA